MQTQIKVIIAPRGLCQPHSSRPVCITQASTMVIIIAGVCLAVAIVLLLALRGPGSSVVVRSALWRDRMAIMIMLTGLCVCVARSKET